MFDGNRGSSYCSGNALVRSMAAMALTGGGEIVYVGMYGSVNGGATLPGHVLSVRMNANGTWSAWQDLALNPVSNDPLAMNSFGLDVSSLFIDPHDPTGNTIYATVAGVPNAQENICVLYGSVDGGAHWFNLRSNLVSSPANSLVIDPLDTNTAYLATDVGVYFTRNVSSCANAPSACWTAFGNGLPASPVTALSAAPAGVSPSVLVAGTFGRGVWQIPLVTAGVQLTTASVSPVSLDFGTQGFGITSGAMTVVVTNTGGIAMSPTAIAVTGDFLETDNCTGATVNAGSGCAIQVSFRPSQAGNRTGKLTVGANVVGGALTVALSGTGSPPGVVSLMPTAIDFGQVEVRSTSKPLSITAENSGGTVVGVTSVTVSGPFALVNNSCGATSLAANSDCQLTVAFQPTASGAATGALILVDDAGTQSVQLKGTGAAPATDSLSTRSLSFPQTIAGQTSAAQTVTLSNTGDLPLTAITATVSGPFQLSSSCTTQLAARSSCSLSIVFTPTQAGTATGTLTVSDVTNAGQTVSLTGTGLQAPTFSVSPASLAFPAQQVAVASAPATVTITNSGGAAMANVGFAITGPSASSFSTGTSTCGATLAAGVGCSVQVIFTPVASGGSMATLNISSSTLGVKAVSVPLTGIGQSATGLNVSPAQLTFAAQNVGQASAPQIVTIANAGSTVVSGLAITVSGPFSVGQNGCGPSLASGASCTTGVVFTPTSLGNLGGLLTVSSTSVAAPATVALSGIGGLTSTVQMVPGLVTFPTTGVGTTSSPVTVTVTNSSDAAALADLKLSASAGFKIGNSTCGGSLAAGASCAIGVSFAPAATGAQTGSLSLTSSVLASSATVSLSGMGFDFQATTSGASSVTIAGGQTAAFTLTLTPSSGSGATFALQCDALPSYAACVFNPARETVAAGATGTVIVQVTSSQGTSAEARPPVFGRWAAWPTLAFIALPAVWRKRKKALFVILPCVFLAFGISGCSSSGGGTGGTPPSAPTRHTTPAGTYSIPVTVSAYGVKHPVTLTLVVD
jgi:hypothetical protein